MAAISPLGMAIIAILAKIWDCSDAETNKYFQSEKSEWGVNALGVLRWLADHTCHELHDSIKLHSSCIMRSNHVQERLCLEPSEHRPAGTSVQLMACSIAVRLQRTHMVHPQFTHTVSSMMGFCYITTIKQVLLATKEKRFPAESR